MTQTFSLPSCAPGVYNSLFLSFCSRQAISSCNRLIGSFMGLDSNSWIARSRKVGIDESIPILPGIMPISNYAGFKRMTGFCKTRVPEAMAKALEEASKLKTEEGEVDKAAFAQVSTELVTKLCKVHSACPELRRQFYASVGS